MGKLVYIDILLSQYHGNNYNNFITADCSSNRNKKKKK